MTESKKTPELRFPGFTEPWEEKKLGEVLLKTYNGQTPSRFKNEYWNGNINWLSSGELNRSIVRDTIEKITDKGREKTNLKVVPKGTFIIAITGLEAEGTRGNCGKLGINTTINQSCMALFPNTKIMSTDFLFYWYIKYGKRYGVQYTQGTKQQSYNAKIINILPINIPYLAEQEKIGSFFSSLDKKLDLQKDRLEELKSYKKGMMQRIFDQEIRFKDENGRNYPDWQEKKLGEMADYGKAGGTPKTTNDEYYMNGKIPFLSISDITKQGKKIYETEKTITELGLKSSSTWLVPKNSLIYSMYASIGFVAINMIELCTSQAMYSIILKDKYNLDYTYYYLNYHRVQKVTRLIETGTQGNLNATLVRGIKINVPSFAEQEKIASFLSALDRKIELEEEKLRSYEEFKKGLMQRMFV